MSFVGLTLDLWLCSDEIFIYPKRTQQDGTIKERALGPNACKWCHQNGYLTDPSIVNFGI